MTTHRALVVALALLGACASPPNVGTIAQAVNVAPNTYDFGSWMVGTAATPRQFIVAPFGIEYDIISSITSACADFDVDLSLLDSPPEVYRECEDPNPEQLFLPPICFNRTQRFLVTFTPSFAGPQGCPITVAMDSGTNVIANVTGTGVAPPVALTIVTPASGALGFGDVILGSQSTALPVTIRNDGSAALDLHDAVITGPDAIAFTLATTDSEPLGPGQTFTWQLTCTPAAPIALAATFTITSDAGTHDIALSCTGIQSNLVVAPSPLQFAETLLGAERTDAVTLTNSGTAPLVITSSLIVAGPFTAADLAATSLAAGESVVLTVAFAPTAADVGTDVRGSLVVTFNDGVDSRTIDLVGPARDAALALTPSGTIDFGTVCAGQSREQIFVALNSGSGGVDLLDAVIAGSDVGFAVAPIAPASFPAPLLPRGGGSASFRVTATPPIGDVVGELIVTTAIPNSEPTVVPLHAIGQDRGLGASPGAVDFGGVVVDEPSGGRTIRISNCDPTALELSSATVTGEHADEFVVVSADQTLPITLPGGGSALFIVELRPTSGGDKVATLEIVHAAGTTTIALTGIGVGALAPGGSSGPGSYYACSAGGAAGLAPIAAALALLLRRRRRAR